MENTTDVNGWAIRFAAELRRIGTKAECHLLVTMAQELHPKRAGQPPKLVARQWVELHGLPHDD